MAIYQISKIQVRKGLRADLPSPLDGGEFGWSVDQRRLWIGNGTLAEGAPVVGNTEILTAYSNLVPIIAGLPELDVGDYVIEAGKPTVLLDAQPAGTTIPDPDGGIVDVNTAISPTVQMNYTITRGGAIRRGTFTVVSAGISGTLTWDDNYTENAVTGITLGAVELSPSLEITHASTATGQNATLKYSLTYFI